VSSDGRRTLAWLFLGLAALANGACSREGEPGSCFRERENLCLEYDRVQGAAGKRMCSGMTWTGGASSCPSASRLGTCVKQSGAEYVYGGAPNNYTPSSAKTWCEWARGVFTPSLAPSANPATSTR
jgi:hypothetical protein